MFRAELTVSGFSEASRQTSSRIGCLGEFTREAIPERVRHEVWRRDDKMAISGAYMAGAGHAC